jgi:hypothetical protein
MSQTSYPSSAAEAFAGMKADVGFTQTEAGISLSGCNFGRGAGAPAGELSYVRVPKKNVATLTLSTNFIASNSTIVTINSVATAAVVYATSHANTATLLLAAISGLSTVLSATKDAAGLVYTVVLKDSAAAATAVTTLGATQPTWTIAYTGDSVFRGIAVHIHNVGGTYAANEAVSVLRRGCIWVDTSVAVTKDDAAYVDLADASGKFTNVSSANLATGGVFKSTVAAAGLAKVEINLP